MYPNVVDTLEAAWVHVLPKKPLAKLLKAFGYQANVEKWKLFGQIPVLQRYVAEIQSSGDLVSVVPQDASWLVCLLFEPSSGFSGFACIGFEVRFRKSRL